MKTNLEMLDEAQADLQEGLAIVRPTGIEESPTVSDLLTNLGVVYQLQGKAEEALGFFEPALAMREKFYDPDSPDVLEADLGWTVLPDATDGDWERGVPEGDERPEPASRDWNTWPSVSAIRPASMFSIGITFGLCAGRVGGTSSVSRIFSRLATLARSVWLPLVRPMPLSSPPRHPSRDLAKCKKSKCTSKAARCGRKFVFARTDDDTGQSRAQLTALLR